MSAPAALDDPPTPRTALVLSGGSARGAYEAGVLAHVFEHLLPQLGPDAGFDVLSGTSVGAIHAAYTASSSHLDGAERARRLVETWNTMEIGRVIRLDARDLLALPLRALGLSRGRSRGEGIVGGLVDVSALEDIVRDRVPWPQLEANLERRRAVLCVSCTEVRSGRVTVFMDGPLADPTPWEHDPNANAIRTPLSQRHVRASAAIPFFFPAVRLGQRYYVDGGLRMNTPLSPALRLRADRILVIAMKHSPPAGAPEAPPYPEDVITQPAFLIGKVLDALTLDQLEYELHRVGLVNALLDRGVEVYGEDFISRINVAVREHRGVGFRPVTTTVIRPSEDIGRVAARCYRKGKGARSLGVLPHFVARAAQQGVPADEADLLSYLYFDREFTSELVEMGREDARAREEEIAKLLTG